MNQLKLGSLLSYLQLSLGIVIGLLYTPLMIRLLGRQEYGLYNTVSSTISMLSILSLGFNSGYIRYYARYKEENNQEAVSRLNGLFLLIFSAIGTIALLCGLYLSEHLPLVFHEGLAPEEYEIAHVLMLILTVNMAVSFPMSVFQTIITAHEKFIFLKTLSILRTVLGPMLTLPLLLMGYRSIAMVSMTVVVSLIVDISYLVFVLRKLKERFVFKGFEKGLFRGLLVFTSFIALNIVFDQINWNIDKVILGRFKGTAEVAVYAVGFSLYNYDMMISTAVSGIFIPRIHQIYNANKENPDRMNKQFTDLFVRVGRIQYLILALVASGFCFFGQAFIRLWVGAGYENSYYVALLLILPALVELTQNIGIEIQRAENKHKFRSIVYTVMALLNLGLSVWLCQLYGAIGSTIGTAISLIVANGLIMNIYYYRKCGIGIPEFWKNILRMSRGLIIPVGAGLLLNQLIAVTSYGRLILCILIYTVVYIGSVWMFSMDESEKRLLLTPMKRITNKIKKRSTRGLHDGQNGKGLLWLLCMCRLISGGSTPSSVIGKPGRNGLTTVFGKGESLVLWI
ncbi:MAG: oligosaccharide flippase family protein [Clostridiales bacterium]|nr:oligosaccharide flippase family protein [Clostridiales bacterium]